MSSLKNIIALALLSVLSIVQPSYGQIKQKYIQSIHNDRITIYEVLNSSGNLGHSVWINRTQNPNINAKYFADKTNYQSVYNRYNKWKNDKTLITVFSGTFTHDYTKPKGVTIDNGKIINRSIDNTMDGLVIVYQTGGIVVSDLSEANLKIPDKYTSKLLNIRDEFDKKKFFEFTQKDKATVFQTQLLIYNNVLKCKPHNEYKERRFLILAKDKDDQILHIIFNIPKNVQLYEMAKELLVFFQNSDRTIIAMLNLDTGANDMMEVYNNDGSIIPALKGKKDISKAINILSYYY